MGYSLWLFGLTSKVVLELLFRLTHFLESLDYRQVILFCHFPIHPANVHNLWNANVLTELLSNYSCVVAYINGHNHEGNYGTKDKIHYLTLKGMVNTTENAYSIIEVHKDQLLLKGVGRQEDREMRLPANE